MTKPIARFDAEGALWLTFPYSVEFREELKVRIPVPYRRFDGASQQWHVSRVCAEFALLLMRLRWPHTEVQGDPAGQSQRPAPGAPPSALDAHYRVLHLLPTAPRPLVDAAYRTLAKLEHPDLLPEDKRGAANARMAAINRAHATITGRG